MSQHTEIGRTWRAVVDTPLIAPSLVLAICVIVMGTAPALAVEPPPVDRGEESLEAWLVSYAQQRGDDLAGHEREVLNTYLAKWKELNTPELADEDEQVIKQLKNNLLVWAEQQVKSRQLREVRDSNRASSLRYVVVPIHGPIGTTPGGRGTVYADTVEFILRRCVNAGVEHVVFDIDSPGGSVAEANDVVKVLKRYDEHLMYHAYIRRGLSAAIDVVLMCDRWQARTDASFGAAVIIFPETMPEDQRAKARAARVTHLQGLAEAKGHPVILPKAMTILSATAAGWIDAQGVPDIDTAPQVTDGDELVFHTTSEEVLALTGKQLHTLQLAAPAPPRPAPHLPEGNHGPLVQIDVVPERAPHETVQQYLERLRAVRRSRMDPELRRRIERLESGQ